MESATSPNKPFRRRRWLKVAGIFLLLAVVGYFGLPWAVPWPEALSHPVPAGVRLTDRHGTPLRRLLAEGRRAGETMPLAEIPAALIEATLAAGKPLAAVCHAPGVLRLAKAADGSPLVRGRQVTGFANSEEKAAGLTDVVPFLVEDMLKSAGGQYSQAPTWQAHVVTDGLLITGQNPASSEPAAQALLAMLAASDSGRILRDAERVDNVSKAS